MCSIRRILAPLGLALSLGFTLVHAFAADGADKHTAPGAVSLSSQALTYYTQEGDTLIAIANRFTGHAADWAKLAEVNHIAKDVNIPIGTPIVVPAELLADDPVEAKVVAFSGQVAVTGRDGQAITLGIGAKVSEGMQVDTGNSGFVTLSLPDDSRITLPSNSRVKFAKLRLSRYLKSPRTEITLIRGQVESRVTPLKENKGRFEIHTPMSVAGVRGTHFRVQLADKKAATEVLEGNVATGMPGKPDTVMVATNKGNITNTQSVGEPVDLLPAPRVVASERTAYPAARFTFDPLAGAAAYHLQISADQAGQNIIAEGRSAKPEMTIASVPNGSYFMRASAVDQLGLEGQVRVEPLTLASFKAPAAPGVAHSDAKSVTLAWPAQPGKKFNLQVAKDANFTWLVTTETTDAAKITLPRPPFGTYYARIRLVDSDGNMGPFSAVQPFVVTDRWVMNDGTPGEKRAASKP